jgi:hypothetical protein
LSQLGVTARPRVIVKLEPTVVERTVVVELVVEVTPEATVELTAEATVVKPTAVEPTVEAAVGATTEDKSGPSLIVRTWSFCSSTTKQACSKLSKMSLLETCVSTPVSWLNWELFLESR